MVPSDSDQQYELDLAVFSVSLQLEKDGHPGLSKRLVEALYQRENSDPTWNRPGAKKHKPYVQRSDRIARHSFSRRAGRA